MFRVLLRNARAQTLIPMLVAVTILASLVPGPALAQPAPDPSPQARSGEDPDGVWIPGTEVVALRTATTRTYLGDHPGQYVDKMYTEPVNFRQGADWKPIDSTLGSSASGRRKNKANKFSVSFADRSDDVSVGELALDSEHSVGFALDGAARVAGQATKNQIKYSKVQNNTDLRLTSISAGLKEEMILTSADSPTRFVFPLRLKGLTAELDDSGDVVYRDAAGLERARTPRGIMYDSGKSGSPGEPPALSDHVYYALIPHGTGTALEVRIDEQWVRSRDRNWPISVDPSFVSSAAADDTFVVSNFPYSFWNWPDVWAGAYYSGGVKYIANGFVHFGTNTLWGKNIDSAVLWGRESAAYNCGTGLEPVAKVATDTWQATALTTYPGPATDPGFGSIAGQVYQGTCGSRSASWNITQIARHWASSGAGNGSLAFIGSADVNKFRTYKSAETGPGNGMYLSASYTVDGSPFGIFESVVLESPGFGDGPATLGVQGWMIDPNSTAPTNVVVKNAFAGLPQPAGNTFVADASRPDVANNYPGYGPSHGFSVPVQSTGTPGPYQVCVVGKNTFGSGGDTPLPCQNINVVNKPGAPQVNASTTGADGDVTVTWTPPASGGSPITTYEVKAIDASGSQVGPAQSCNCTSKPFANLAAGTYRFEVIARNQAYPGSNGATGFVEHLVARRPDAPTAVSGSGGPSSALITWTAPSDNGSPITRYDFTAFDQTTPESPPVSKPCSDPCSPSDGFAFDGLVPGHSYTFQATATNAAGTSPASAASAPVTVRGTPDYVDEVVATPSDRNVRLDWQAKFLATSYRIKTYLGTRPANGVADPAHLVSSAEVSAADTTETISNLNNGSHYYFTVTPVVLLLLVGPPTTSSNEAIPFGVPFAPQDVQALPSDGSAIVMWNQPVPQAGTPGDNGSPITGYRITVFEDGVTDPVNAVEVAPEPTLAAVEGLQNGVQYSFTVQGINAAGAGAEASTSGTLSPGGRPFAPENVSATLAADRTVSVSWDPPGTQLNDTPGDNGHQITGYRVIVTPSCPSCEGTEVGPVTATTVTGLSAGTTYDFVVVARNGFGQGPASTPPQTVAVSAEVPDAPASVVAEWDPNSPVVRVAWAAPADNGSPIVSYRVTGFPGDLEMTTTGTTAVFENLDPVFAYTFLVRATNGIGEGPPSAASDPAGSPTQAPNLLTVRVKPGDRSAELEWEYASSLTDQPFGHVVTITRWVEQTPELVAEIHTGPSNSATVNVEPGEYVFAVRAHNAAGDGDELETDRVAVWHRAQVEEWMFGYSLSEFLDVRETLPYPYSFDSDGCSVNCPGSCRDFIAWKGCSHERQETSTKEVLTRT